MVINSTYMKNRLLIPIIIGILALSLPTFTIAQTTAGITPKIAWKQRPHQAKNIKQEESKWWDMSEYARLYRERQQARKQKMRLKKLGKQ